MHKSRKSFVSVVAINIELLNYVLIKTEHTGGFLGTEIQASSLVQDHRFRHTINYPGSVGTQERDPGLMGCLGMVTGAVSRQEFRNPRTE